MFRWHHGSLPCGCPRWTLRRIASRSFLSSARLIRETQSSGRGVGQAASSNWRARSSPLAYRPRLDHRQDVPFVMTHIDSALHRILLGIVP